MYDVGTKGSPHPHTTEDMMARRKAPTKSEQVAVAMTPSLRRRLDAAVDRYELPMAEVMRVALVRMLDADSVQDPGPEAASDDEEPDRAVVAA